MVRYYRTSHMHVQDKQSRRRNYYRRGTPRRGLELATNLAFPRFRGEVFILSLGVDLG